MGLRKKEDKLKCTEENKTLIERNKNKILLAINILTFFKI